MEGKRLILILFISFYSSYLFAQQPSSKDKNYYLKVLDTVTDKRTKAETLEKLLVNADSDLQFAEYTEQSVALFLELEEYSTAADIAIYAFYYINKQLGDTERAMKLMASIERHIDKYDSSYIIGNIHLKKAGGYFRIKEFKKAKESYSSAIDGFSDTDSIYIADSYFFRGQVNFQMNDFQNALNDYTAASNFYENLGDKQYYFYSLGDIINIYAVIGFHEKSVKERKKMIEKKLNLNYKEGLAVDYYNQSISYKKLNNDKDQKINLLRALKISKEDKNQFEDPAYFYAALAKYHANEDLKIAAKYLDSSETELNKKQLSPFRKASYDLLKSYVFYKKKNYNKALVMNLAILNSAEQSSNTLILRDTYKNLYQLYEAKNEPINSLKYYKKYNTLNDSLLNVTKVNGLSYYQSLYESERRDKEIAQQQSDIEILDTQNKAQKQLIIFGSLGFVFVFLVVILIRKRRQLQKEKEIQDIYSQKLLISQEKDRKRISKDLHDGLGHSLLIVKNKLIEKKDSETQQLVSDVIEEMRTISRGLHPHQLEEFGLSRALENLILQLDQNHKDTYIFGDIENVDKNLNPLQSLNIFRIVQECLSNVVKHANAISAEVNLQIKNNKIHIAIRDNGKGFDFSQKYSNIKTLGLKTIEERVKFLNGKFNIISNKNQGTSFSIEIPYL